MNTKRLIGMLKAVITEPYLTSTTRVEKIRDIVAEAEKEMKDETRADVSEHS